MSDRAANVGMSEPALDLSDRINGSGSIALELKRFAALSFESDRFICGRAD
jgi:hypothetical protein